MIDSQGGKQVKKNIVRVAVMMITVGVFMAMTGCVFTQAGPAVLQSRTVELGEADSVYMTIRMGAGEIFVTRGEGELLEADFECSEDWMPELNYKVTGTRGELTLQQPSNSVNIVSSGNVKNVWELALADSVPLYIDVELGAGKGFLDLKGLNVSSLDMVMGAGDVTVDFGGDWDRAFTASIKGGVGRAKIFLPEDVGVKVSARGGLGDIKTSGLTKDGDMYVNDAYSPGEKTLEISVEGGIGEIILQVGN